MIFKGPRESIRYIRASLYLNNQKNLIKIKKKIIF